MPAISATDVRKTHGDVTALNGLSLTIDSGSMFGLLGTNGAGKTTLFKLLIGHLRPDAGRLSVAGRDVTEAGPELRQMVGYLPEQAGFPPSLTGREVVRFHARMRGLPASVPPSRVENVLETVGLEEDASRPVGEYSNGMNRRLGLATALLSRPRILLLDEPTAGLDPLGVATFHRVVRRLHDQGDLTVVLSSHALSEAELLCDSVAILHDGELKATGSVTELYAGIDERRTVRVRLTDADARPTVVDRVTELADCSVRSASGTRVDLGCSSDSLPSLLEELAEMEPVGGYAVAGPDLEQVFRAVLDAGPIESQSPDPLPREVSQ